MRVPRVTRVPGTGSARAGPDALLQGRLVPGEDYALALDAIGSAWLALGPARQCQMSSKPLQVQLAPVRVPGHAVEHQAERHVLEVAPKLRVNVTVLS